jgi:PAS domain S-box-containing protein
MLTRIKRWLEPPLIDGDEEKKEQMRIANTLMVYLGAALLIAFFVLIPLFAVQKIGGWILTATMFSGLAVGRQLIFRGRFRLGCILIFSDIYLCLLLMIIFSGSSSSAAMFFFASAVLIAGFVMDMRVVNWLTIPTYLVVMGISLLQNMGLTLPKIFIFTPVISWLAIGLGLVFMIRARDLFVGNLNRALARTKQKNAALQEAKATLHESEALFFNAFNNSPLLMTISDLSTGRYLEVNDSFCLVSEFNREEAIGKTSIDLGWLGEKEREQLVHELQQHGKVTGLELSLRSKSGKTVICRYSGDIIQTAEGNKLFSTAEDITERKRAELQQEILFQVLHAVSSQLDAELIAHEAVKTLVRLTGYPHVCVALPDENGTHWVVRGAAGSLAAELGATYAIHQGVIGKTFETGQFQWVRDVMDDPNYVRDVNKAGTPALRSELVAPMHHGDRLLGALNIESDCVDAFDDSDARMIQSVADIIALALENARLYRKAQQEINERKQAEAALKVSEEHYRLLVETLPDGVVVHSQGRIVFVNPGGAKIIGAASPDELIGMPVMGFVHPDYRELVLTRIQQSLIGLPAPTMEEKFIRIDGKIIDVTVVTVPVTYSDKPAIMTVVTDITERKRAEGAQRASEDLYHAMFEQAGDGVFLLDTNGKIISINEMFAKMHGYTVEEMLRLGLAGLDVEGTASLPGRIRRMIAGETLSFEVEHFHSDGHTFPLAVTSNLISSGNEKLIIAFHRDITERKRAENKIQELNTELEQRVEERTYELRQAQEQLVRQEKLAVLGQLAGSVGHELRNPLGVINSAIYYLKLVQPEASEKIKDHHTMIEQEVRNANKIITDLLDFARVKSVEREPVSVARLVGQTFERFPVPPSVELKLELPEDLPMVFIDQRQMEQVLGNLVVNACQAMNKGGELIISTYPDKEMLAIAVEDTGIGITPENMKKIFEPLFTTKAKGIGLGLAVSKKLAEANGGRIEVDSEPGEGSTFTVYLPVHTDA